MIGATYKRLNEADQNCAFLCHVSTRTTDHKHIVDLLRKYNKDLADGLAARSEKVVNRLKHAYDDLASTDAGLRATPFANLNEAIEFFSPGIMVKLVNGETDEDVAVRSPYNLFVGGNKLGRGVTIKNLLVSYYGRHPRKPQADTVLQHARMYGYRRHDIGLLRLFLPHQLHMVFKAIHKMEKGLRDLIAKDTGEEFRGVYLEGGLSPTRKSVLAPGSIGVYSAGSNYNPAQVLRDDTITAHMEKIDKKLAYIGDQKYVELPIEEMQALINLTMPDTSVAEHVWNSAAIVASLGQYAKLQNKPTGYVYVDRDLDARRRETAGILAGGEYTKVPGDKIALYILRTKGNGRKRPSWWPQLRFPDGRYAFAFAI